MAHRERKRRQHATLQQLLVCVLNNTDVVKYSSWELLQFMNPSVAIKPELKTVLGRLRLLRKAGWRRETFRLRGRRKRCAQKQKRGKRAGKIAGLKANTKPTNPTLLLSNVHSQDNKIDLMRL